MTRDSFVDANLNQEWASGKPRPGGALGTQGPGPTPATESILAFLQTGLNPRHRSSFSDVRNAVCQSDKPRRAGGPIVARPCWWTRFNDRGVNEAQVLIEMDDFIISATEEDRAEIRRTFESHFTFGKWEDDEAEYAGRRIQVQQKYITEQLQPVILKTKARRKGFPLDSGGVQCFRSAIYKVNWVARERGRRWRMS